MPVPADPDLPWLHDFLLDADALFLYRPAGLWCAHKSITSLDSLLQNGEDFRHAPFFLSLLSATRARIERALELTRVGLEPGSNIYVAAIELSEGESRPVKPSEDGSGPPEVGGQRIPSYQRAVIGDISAMQPEAGAACGEAQPAQAANLGQSTRSRSLSDIEPEALAELDDRPTLVHSFAELASAASPGRTTLVTCTSTRLSGVSSDVGVAVHPCNGGGPAVAGPAGGGREGGVEPVVLDTVDTTGDGVPDSVVLDTSGDGLFDALRPIVWQASPRITMQVRRGSKDSQREWAHVAMAEGRAGVDTTGDGQVDSVALDTNADGYIDTLRPLNLPSGARMVVTPSHAGPACRESSVAASVRPTPRHEFRPPRHGTSTRQSQLQTVYNSVPHSGSHPGAVATCTQERGLGVDSSGVGHPAIGLIERR